MIGHIGDCAGADQYVVSVHEIPRGRFEKCPWTTEVVLSRYSRGVRRTDKCTRRLLDPVRSSTAVNRISVPRGKINPTCALV